MTSLRQLPCTHDQTEQVLVQEGTENSHLQETMIATSATTALCVPHNDDKKDTRIVPYLRKYCSSNNVTRQERDEARNAVLVVKLDRCRFLFDTPKLENGLSRWFLYEMQVTFEEILGNIPAMMPPNNSSTELLERHNEPRQTMKESLMIRFTSPGAAVEERSSAAVSENDLQTEKGTLELSSNSYDRERRTSIEETHDELHMKEHTVTQNDETWNKGDYDKKENDTKASGAVGDEQSDVSDFVSDFEENGSDPYVSMSGLNDVHMEPEMKFGVDRDYSYTWVDDMWTVYGTRPRTRDEREYEADMEKIQAEYEMEFELNRCDPYSLMNGFTNDGTHNENDYELEYSNEESRSGVNAVQSVITDENPDEKDFVARGSYSGVNSVEGDQTEKTGNDEARSGMYEEPSGVPDKENLEAHGAYSGVNSVESDQTERTGTDKASSGMYDEQSDVTDYHGTDCDDSYSSINEKEIVHSEYDMNIETDSEDSYRWMDGMEAFYGATLKIDHEKVEDERARRKEMDIAHWIETVNKEMFPHLITQSQVLGFVESLASTGSGHDDVQSVVTEDETEGEAYSDYSYTNGSQSDYEEDLSEETSEETDESQRAVMTNNETDYDAISDDSCSRTNRRPKTRDDKDYETNMHRGLTDENQRQELGVADCAATVNNELLLDLKTTKVENNVVTRGCLGRCLARFFAAARCFFQRFVFRWY